MKVACVGGGPASLYLSILLKLQDPRHEVAVYERHPKGTTYGWGVTYWPDMLETLERHDEPSARRILADSLCWRDGVAHVNGRTTVHSGDTGYAVSRHRLLGILADRAQELGVQLEFDREVDGDSVPDADVVVAGDGARSRIRERHAESFGTRVSHGANRYIWLGTTRVFEAFTFSFVETAHGWIWCYAYGFGAEHSTCIVECSEETWTGLGLHRLPQDVALRLLERTFCDVLEGHPLLGRTDIEGHAQWQPFATVTNERWAHGNVVLVGDAAHTTHYSIGAGTTLAMRDAMSLAQALGDAPRDGIGAALERYGQERRRALLPAQSAARLSAQWYENLTRYVTLEPEQMFALLGQRHSPLLPHVPPQLYYRLDQAAGSLRALRWLKQRVGSRLASALEQRR
ncbi:FAD-dependent monooxygenase [Streptomyces sp. NPDC050504]|uniref:FAD-dependent monooxygenase n=1 Tax=Streptomyces sp. NPDC050504 TaxID=3365618 RepID=UPI003788B27E